MSGPRLRPGDATDTQGRRRFHGAFTGGFSAGYFNTVGSEEGFQAGQYHSSRGRRAAPVEQPLSKFMDEEDGLLGGRLAARQV